MVLSGKSCPEIKDVRSIVGVSGMRRSSQVKAPGHRRHRHLGALRGALLYSRAGRKTWQRSTHDALLYVKFHHMSKLIHIRLICHATHD